MVSRHRVLSGSCEVAMRFMRALNHLVAATESVARIIVIAGIALVAYYAADREPPFAVLSVEPAEARAGDYITIVANVRREVDRMCDADFSRYLYDATGARYDMGHAIASAEMIAALERRDNGRLRVSFLVPYGAAPGAASLQSVLNYKCNKIHRLWPITVTTELPFTVLP